MTPLVIVGAGGHGREVLDAVESMDDSCGAVEFLGFLDDGDVQQERLDARGVTVLGGTDLLASIDAGYVVGVGSPTVRRRVDGLASSHGRVAITVVHRAATVGGDVSIGPGSVLFAGSRLTTNIRAGCHLHVNLNATISHDCRIGDFVTLSPGATVSGNVVLGDAVIIGAGATVLPGVRVGEGAMVGAGAAVVDDVEPGVTVVGVPARPLP